MRLVKVVVLLTIVLAAQAFLITSCVPPYPPNVKVEGCMSIQSPDGSTSGELPGATITFVHDVEATGIRVEVATDEDGCYETQLPGGSYEVHATHPDYADYFNLPDLLTVTYDPVNFDIVMCPPPSPHPGIWTTPEDEYTEIPPFPPRIEFTVNSKGTCITYIEFVVKDPLGFQCGLGPAEMSSIPIGGGPDVCWPIEDCNFFDIAVVLDTHSIKWIQLRGRFDSPSSAVVDWAVYSHLDGPCWEVRQASFYPQ